MDEWHMMDHMVRKQVLVQLDDELVAALDELAAEHGVSRSELLRRGAQAILDSAEMLRLEKQHVEAYRRHPQDLTFVRAALEASVAPLDPYEEG